MIDDKKPGENGTTYYKFQRGPPLFLSSLLYTSSDLAVRLRTCAFYCNWARATDAHPSGTGASLL